MILLRNKALKLVGKLLTFVNFKNVPTDRLKRLRQMGFKVEVNTGDEKKDFHSQYGQDYLVYTRYFTQNPRSGTFIDFGAHDGITFSNTCFFERVLGWSGILVEPNPNVFSKLQKNRDTISINVGVGPKEGVRLCGLEDYDAALAFAKKRSQIVATSCYRCAT